MAGVGSLKEIVVRQGQKKLHLAPSLPHAYRLNWDLTKRVRAADTVCPPHKTKRCKLDAPLKKILDSAVGCSDGLAAPLCAPFGAHNSFRKKHSRVEWCIVQAS